MYCVEAKVNSENEEENGKLERSPKRTLESRSKPSIVQVTPSSSARRLTQREDSFESEEGDSSQKENSKSN